MIATQDYPELSAGVSLEAVPPVFVGAVRAVNYSKVFLQPYTPYTPYTPSIDAFGEQIRCLLHVLTTVLSVAA